MGTHKLYRIMVEGEDGTVFCYDDEIGSRALPKVMEEAEGSYPCAQIWAEEMLYFLPML